MLFPRENHRTPRVPPIRQVLICEPDLLRGGKFRTVDGDPVQQPPSPVVVIGGVVPGGAIVPERQRTRLPTEPTGEFRRRGVAVEVVEQGGRFLCGPAVEAQGEARVDVERRTVPARRGLFGSRQARYWYRDDATSMARTSSRLPLI